jgi:F-type H+-transporting ATPase subunit epsilon
MAFKCTVATPEGLLFDNTITSAVLPAHDGQIGILTGHSPILVKLGAGLLNMEVAGSTVTYFISGGVAQMKDNVLTVLSDEATTTDKLNVEAARKELAELSGSTTTGDFTSRTRRLARARAVLHVAGASAD